MSRESLAAKIVDDKAEELLRNYIDSKLVENGLPEFTDEEWDEAKGFYIELTRTLISNSTIETLKAMIEQTSSNHGNLIANLGGLLTVLINQIEQNRLSIGGGGPPGQVAGFPPSVGGVAANSNFTALVNELNA